METLEIIGGSCLLMLAWAAIAILMYEGNRVAFKAELKAEVQSLAKRLYQEWVENTEFRIHTGVRIIDEMKKGGDDDDLV